MIKNDKTIQDFLKPPTSVKNAELKIFSERFVRMSGRDYYLRVFADGTGEFTRFDTESGKWVFLILPVA
jgi:hypothetical protein